MSALAVLVTFAKTKGTRACAKAFAFAIALAVAVAVAALTVTPNKLPTSSPGNQLDNHDGHHCTDPGSPAHNKQLITPAPAHDKPATLALHSWRNNCKLNLSTNDAVIGHTLPKLLP